MALADIYNTRSAWQNQPWGSGSAWSVPGSGGGGGAVSIPNPAALGAGAGQYVNAALGSYPGMPGIQQDLSGVIAPDVKRAIFQAAAERGVSIGSYDSPNVDSNLLRGIGLTSDALRARGQNELVSATNALPRYDTSSQYVNPNTQANINSAASLEASGNAAAAQRQAAQLGASSSQFNATLAAENARYAQQTARQDSSARATNEMINNILGRYGGQGSDPWTGAAPSSAAGPINTGNTNSNTLYAPQDQWEEDFYYGNSGPEYIQTDFEPSLYYGGN